MVDLSVLILYCMGLCFLGCFAPRFEFVDYRLLGCGICVWSLLLSFGVLMAFVELGFVDLLDFCYCCTPWFCCYYNANDSLLFVFVAVTC